MKNKEQSQKKMLTIFAIMVLLTIGIVSNCGCLGKNENTIKIEGAFALTPMMEKWKLEYRKIHPEINMDINSNGAGAGMADALLGIADIGMVSREINNTEIEQGAFWVSVVKDAVVATINSDNPVLEEILEKGVTKQQFKDIFITRNITTWGQLVGNESLSDDPIVVYTRSDSCGAAETWAKYLGKYKQNDLTNALSNPNLPGAAVNGDNSLAAAIQGDEFGIGYNNIGYVYTNKLADNTVVPADGIIPVPIDLNENGMIDENESIYANRNSIVTAINNYVYPSPPARPLHLVTLHNFTGIVKDFVYWILTDGQQYVLDTGYVPLPPETIIDQMGYLENGTRPETQ
jgi:phosphate transport system substrate-binding protein